MAQVLTPKEPTPEEQEEKLKKPWWRCHHCDQGAHGEEAWNAHRQTEKHKHNTGLVNDDPQRCEKEWVPWGKRGKGKGRGKGGGRRQGTWGAKLFCAIGDSHTCS